MKYNFPATYVVEKDGRKIYVCYKHSLWYPEGNAKELPDGSNASCEVCTVDRINS